MELLHTSKLLRAATVAFILGACTNAPHESTKPASATTESPTSSAQLKEISNAINDCLLKDVFGYENSVETKLAAHQDVPVAMGLTITKQIKDTQNRTHVLELENPGIVNCKLPDGRTAKLLFNAREVDPPIDYQGHPVSMELDELDTLIFDTQTEFEWFDPGEPSATNLSLQWTSPSSRTDFTASYRGVPMTLEQVADSEGRETFNFVADTPQKTVPVMRLNEIPQISTS